MGGPRVAVSRAAGLARVAGRWALRRQVARRAHLVRQSTKWRRFAAAMARVLGPEPGRP